MADSLTRQARELTNHASLLRRMAAGVPESDERPRARPAGPSRSTGPMRPGRPEGRPEGRSEGRGGFGGERSERGERGSFEPRSGGGPRSRPSEGERPRKRTGESPSWAPKKRKK